MIRKNVPCVMRKCASPSRRLPWFVGIGLLLLCLSVFFSSCTEESESRYARLPAYFRFAPTAAVPPLRNAVRNPGQWCLVTYDARTYRFADLSGGTATYPRTALEAYGRPQSVAGLVIGTPSVPDLNGAFAPAAFDLVCPVCYDADAIERRLVGVAAAPERLRCERCGRRYDLTNGGVPVETPHDGRRNRSMYRYRLGYNPEGDVVVIQN